MNAGLGAAAGGAGPNNENVEAEDGATEPTGLLAKNLVGVELVTVVPPDDPNGEAVVAATLGNVAGFGDVPDAVVEVVVDGTIIGHAPRPPEGQVWPEKQGIAPHKR